MDNKDMKEHQFKELVSTCIFGTTTLSYICVTCGNKEGEKEGCHGITIDVTNGYLRKALKAVTQW